MDTQTVSFLTTYLTVLVASTPLVLFFSLVGYIACLAKDKTRKPRTDKR